MENKTFKITMSERCFRFKPDALGSHAPHQPGVYEFVTFDEKVQPIVLFVGVAPTTIYEALANHLMGNIQPTSDELFKAAKDIYFDYVASADTGSPEDFGDIAAALIAKHRPKLNPAGKTTATGRYAAVTLEEVG